MTLPGAGRRLIASLTTHLVGAWDVRLAFHRYWEGGHLAGAPVG